MKFIPLIQTNVYFFNKIPIMPSITDNFIIEVPTMSVEVFLTYLKEKLPIIKNYYYISEIKNPRVNQLTRGIFMSLFCFSLSKNSLILSLK